MGFIKEDEGEFEVSIPITRIASDQLNKDMRRARNLYGYLVAPYLMDNKDKLGYLAERAQSKGLYSEKTLLSDVGFSLVRHCYKRFGDGMNWWEFCDKHKLYYSWFYQCQKKYKNAF